MEAIANKVLWLSTKFRKKYNIKYNTFIYSDSENCMHNLNIVCSITFLIEFCHEIMYKCDFCNKVNKLYIKES